MLQPDGIKDTREEGEAAVRDSDLFLVDRLRSDEVMNFGQSAFAPSRTLVLT